ncbi:MAG: leucine-rich repeat domain-containing protein [Lewinellaceae bacterium]|nr:leucine-rich repeat domain-containing protein [Lewinellaceae bacterium]
MEKLTNLHTLDLSSNQISDIRFLEKLTNLHTLDLSSNQISDIRF